jgi:transcriptional regulator with GAF, ATPase, and Fis domain
VLPPLRERPVDIPQLVSHFVEKFARRMGRRIDRIPQDMLDAFVAYPWPGNVRELQNLIERAVIRSNDGVLSNPLSDNHPATLTPQTPSQDTLTDSTRALILHALNATDWVIGGPGGAATRLGLKRTTLIAKMKKLGISRPVRKGDMDRLNEKAGELAAASGA